MLPKVTFTPTTATDQALLLRWLDKPHVREFWDNSEAHRQNMLNFLQGAKDQLDYYIGYWNETPYALLLTSDCTLDAPEEFRALLQQTGKTFSIDFTIGEENFLGKGLGAPTLQAFMQYICKEVDPEVTTFIIDPAIDNTRAIHVYEKAGFKKGENFTRQGGFFAGIDHILMTKSMV